MEFFGILQILWEVFDKSKTFHEFISKLISAERTELFTQMGDTHWAAAREHLSNIYHADDISKGEVLLAIGALEQAYQLYMHARPKGWKISSSIHLFFAWNLMRREKCSLSACAISLLQSRCYKYLDAQERMQKYAERARECFEESADIHLQIAFKLSENAQRMNSYAFAEKGVVERAQSEIEAQRAIINKIIESLL